MEWWEVLFVVIFSGLFLIIMWVYLMKAIKGPSQKEKGNLKYFKEIEAMNDEDINRYGFSIPSMEAWTR